MTRLVYISMEMTADEWAVVAEKLHSTPGFADVSEHIRKRIQAVQLEDEAMAALKDRQERYYPDDGCNLVKPF